MTKPRSPEINLNANNQWRQLLTALAIITEKPSDKREYINFRVMLSAFQCIRFWLLEADRQFRLPFLEIVPQISVDERVPETLTISLLRCTEISPQLTSQNAIPWTQYHNQSGRMPEDSCSRAGVSRKIPSRQFRSKAVFEAHRLEWSCRL